MMLANMPVTPMSMPPAGAMMSDGIGEVALLTGLIQDLSSFYGAARLMRKIHQKASRALALSDATLRQIADHIGDLVCLHEPNADACYRFVSPAVQRILGYLPETLIGCAADALLHPEDRSAMSRTSPRQVLLGCPEEGLELRYRHRDGHYLWLETRVRPLLTADGHLVALQTLARDVTSRREELDALKALVQWQERILEAAGDGIYGIDTHGHITYFNNAATHMLGWQRDEVQGKQAHELFHHSSEDGTPYLSAHCPVIQALHSGRSCRATDEWFWHRNGHGFPVELVASPLIEDGNLIGCVVVFQDITERRRLQAQLEQLSMTDALTGAPNRRLFLKRLEQELLRLARYGGIAGLVMFDADGFKQVNDCWGHTVGDDVLKRLTAACQRLLRGNDLLGRLGGDEFVVLLPETTLAGAQLFAERLRRAIEQLTIRHGDATLTFTISLGVTTIQGNDSADSALERVDRALYRAKQAGRNCHYSADASTPAISLPEPSTGLTETSAFVDTCRQEHDRGLP